MPSGWTALAGWGDGVGVSPSVTQTRPHTGTRSLESSSDKKGAARIQHALTGNLAQAHWGRLFYRVVSPAPKATNNAYFHVTFASLPMGSIEARVVDTVEDPNGKHQFLYNIPDDSCCTSSSYDWSYDDAWHCAEWNVDVSKKSYHFYIDGSEVTSIGFEQKSQSNMATFNSLAIGTIFYQVPTATMKTWIDDVALDTARVGCGS